MFEENNGMMIYLTEQYDTSRNMNVTLKMFLKIIPKQKRNTVSSVNYNKLRTHFSLNLKDLVKYIKGENTEHLFNGIILYI